MTTMLGSIGEWPWLALAFAAAHWKTAVAAVWGGGFAYLLFRDMRRWYKQDAYDASLTQKDEDAIYREIKSIATTRRADRLKTVVKSHLFWLPMLAFNTFKRIARAIFYPVLVFLDKAQTEGLHAGRKSMVDAIEGSTAPKPSVLVEGVNSVVCDRCFFTVEKGVVHTCQQVASPDPMDVVRPVRKKKVLCGDCGEKVQVDFVHACSERDGDEEEVDDLFCEDCDEHHPANVKHTSVFCMGCHEHHCRRYECDMVAEA